MTGDLCIFLLMQHSAASRARLTAMEFMSCHIRAMASCFFCKKNREIDIRTFSGGEEKLFEKTMECLYGSMQSAQEDSLLVKKGYEGRIENLEILL